MRRGFSEADVAVSLMKEALTLLDTPQAAPAARLLQMAIDAASYTGSGEPNEATDPSSDATEAGE